MLRIYHNSSGHRPDEWRLLGKGVFRILKQSAISIAIVLCVLIPAAHAMIPSEVEGVSLILGRDEDTLVMEMTEQRDPRVSRYGVQQRIVIDFQETEAAYSLKRLIEGKRGGCVEKFEVQEFERTGVIDPVFAPSYKKNIKSTLLVAYIERGVDVDMEVTGNLITARFYRIDEAYKQNRPAPVNELLDISFDKQGDTEFLGFETSYGDLPELYETRDPYRILITYRNTHLSEKVENQRYRYMETPGLYRIEIFGTGSLPDPYPGIDNAGQYHFVGISSPLAVTEYEDRIRGLQSNEVAIAIFPARNVEYSIVRRHGKNFEIAFKKRYKFAEDQQLKMKEACRVFTDKKPEESTGYYDVEDEHGRTIDFLSGE